MRAATTENGSNCHNLANDVNIALHSGLCIPSLNIRITTNPLEMENICIPQLCSLHYTATYMFVQCTQMTIIRLSTPKHSSSVSAARPAVLLPPQPPYL